MSARSKLHKVGGTGRGCKPHLLGYGTIIRELRIKDEKPKTDNPLLHLFFGGEVFLDPRSTVFIDVNRLDIISIFLNNASPLDAWCGANQRHVDNAQIEYVIVHMKSLWSQMVKLNKSPLTLEGCH